jgi:hypothetical protein
VLIVSQRGYDTPNFDEIEDLMGPGPADLSALGGETSVEPILLAEDTSSETAVDAKQQPQAIDAEADEKTTDAAKQSGGFAPYVEWAIAAGIGATIVVLALLGLLFFSTAVYFITVGLIAYGLWRNRRSNDIYIVLLGCALIFVCTAMYFLWTELGRYQFEIKAKQRVSMNSPG